MNTRTKKTLGRLGSLCGGIFTLLLLSACQPEQTLEDVSQSAEFKLPVRFMFGQEALTCDQTVSVESQAWRVNHLAFFISGLAVKTAASEAWQAMTLEPNNWQTEETGLVWFNSHCRNGASSAYNHSLTVNNDSGLWQEATEVKFELAVPFAENHKNPLTQASPLNISEMFWSWQLGHKFIRLDLISESPQESSSWSYHLGSIGCQSASSMRSPTTPCSMPNRFEVILQKASAHNALSFDLSKLLTRVQPGEMRSCMFQQIDEVACIQLANNLQNGQVFSFNQINRNDLSD